MKLLIALACLLAVAFAIELEVAENRRGNWGWNHGGVSHGSWGGKWGNNWGGRGHWGHGRKGRSVETEETEVAQEDIDAADNWNRKWNGNCASCKNTNWGHSKSWGHSKWGHGRWARSVDQEAEESRRWGSHGGHWNGRSHGSNWGGRSHGSWGKSWGKHH